MRGKVLRNLLLVLVWLNLADVACSLVLIGFKFTTEANPIMDIFLQQGPLQFGAAKMSMTVIGSAIVWAGRRSAWAVPAVAAAVVLTSLVVLSEIVMICQLDW